MKQNKLKKNGLNTFSTGFQIYISITPVYGVGVLEYFDLDIEKIDDKCVNNNTIKNIIDFITKNSSEHSTINIHLRYKQTKDYNTNLNNWKFPLESTLRIQSYSSFYTDSWYIQNWLVAVIDGVRILYNWSLD